MLFFDKELPELNVNSTHLVTNNGFLIYELVQTPFQLIQKLTRRTSSNKDLHNLCGEEQPPFVDD